MFMSLAGEDAPASPDDVGPTTLVPAFVISELRTAFTIGFVIFVPFLIVDLVTAAVLMSMGMVMLPPIFVSLPLKLLLFVLVDGWALISRSLVGSVVGA
jgi:flagellar biosynthesis protein FliP